MYWPDDAAPNCGLLTSLSVEIELIWRCRGATTGCRGTLSITLRDTLSLTIDVDCSDPGKLLAAAVCGCKEPPRSPRSCSAGRMPFRVCPSDSTGVGGVTDCKPGIDTGISCLDSVCDFKMASDESKALLNAFTWPSCADTVPEDGTMEVEAGALLSSAGLSDEVARDGHPGVGGFEGGDCNFRSGDSIVPRPSFDGVKGWTVAESLFGAKSLSDA